MRKISLSLVFLFLLPLLSFGQIVSIYCTWDDLEAARQQRVDGIGINKMLRNQGFSVTEKAYPNQASANALVTSSIQYVVGSSHGNATTFFDCNTWQPIWTSDSPSSFSPLRGRIVHLLACQNGQSLAPAMANGGVKAVLAYKENFNFSNNSAENTKHATADAEFDRAMAQGDTSGNAKTRAYNKFMQYANLANAEGDVTAYGTFDHNARCMEIFGDRSARLTKSGEARVAEVAPEQLDRPTDAILQKLPVASYFARGGAINFFEFLNMDGQRSSARYYKDMTEEEFAALAVEFYSSLPENYELGLRNVGMLDKYRMVYEIQSGTELGSYLVRRYRGLLDTVDSLVR